MKLSRPARDRLIAAMGALAIVLIFGGIFLVAKACGNREYTVTYYDGSKVLETATVNKDEKAANWKPENDGNKVFDCWLTESGDKYDFDQPVKSDLKLYAKWK